MFSPLAFFSFIHLSDPSQDRAYNEWHQLDHRPENLALPHVAWGDRWKRSVACAELSAAASEEYAATDYIAMYWFRDPVDHAVADWDALGADSFQWGRGPIIPGIERTLLAFFRPVKGYAAPRALVSPDTLPFRPNRGLHVSLTEFAEPYSSDAHDAFRREDRETIPELLELDGVAGAWTFAFSHPQRHSSLPLDTSPVVPPGSLRLRVLYLDENPLDIAPSVTALDAHGERGAGERVLLSTPVTTIIPWVDW